jgi:hypothetical protein
MEALGLELAGTRPIGGARHTVVNRRVEVAIFRANRRTSGSDGSSRAGRWFLPDELGDAALPTLTRKIAAAGLTPG